MKNGKIIAMHVMPMSSKTNEEIIQTRFDERPKIIDAVCQELGCVPYQIEVIDNYKETDKDKLQQVAETTKTPALHFFGRGIKKIMSKADIVVLGNGWRNSQGCVCEAFIAAVYGIPVINLDGSSVKI